MRILKCDVCGQNKKEDEVLSITHVFGYGTTLDGTKINLDVCEECFIEKFEEELEKVNESTTNI
jgi:hypothetical protein